MTVQLFGGAPVVEIQVPANIAIKSPTELDVIGSLTSELFKPPLYPLSGRSRNIQMR